jgi:two-component system cell cycle sensor histidine kinase/response regulator CckA
MLVQEYYFKNIFNTVHEAILVLDENMRVLSANRSFFTIFKVDSASTIGSLLYDLGNGQWDIPYLRVLLEDILPKNNTVENYEIEHDFESIGQKTMLLNACKIREKKNVFPIILLAIEDITERKRLEDLLTESELQYRRVFETASDGIVLLEKRGGTIIHANPAAEKMLGYSEKECIGKNIQDVGVSLDVSDFATVMQDLSESGILTYHDVPIKTRSGQEIDTDIYLVDRAKLAQCNIRDISERKQSVELLKKEETKYRELAESISDIFIAMDQDLRYTYWNKSSEILTGILAKDAIGKRFSDIFPDNEMTRGLQNFYRNVMRTNTAQHFTSIYPGGRKVIHEISAYPSKGGVAVFVKDITEHKHADEALRESEERFRSIFEQATDGIMIADTETKRLIDANKAICSMLGYSHDEFVGLSIDKIHPKKDLPFIGESFEKQLRGEISLASKVPMLRKDGSVFYADINAAHLTLGGRLCLAGIVRDITGHQKLEDQLRQAQKMESIGTLAGGIAHDFNNILTAIIGYGNIALMKMAKDDPQRVYIEHMLDGGERAAQLTKSLLLFSRKQMSERKPVDLNEIIRTVDKFLKRVIGEDVECRTSLVEETLPIFGDAHQLEQVLMNLATNARDAMSTGGIFTITTERVRLDEAFITNHGYGKPGLYGLIIISDTGNGMDAATREHIFEPFYTTKAVGKGTGLGLAIVYGIIKQHEGFINVYSEPGHGTSFKIYLPLISASVKEMIKPVEEHPRGGTETILLAEDDAAVRTLTTAILEDFGYTVITAVDGQDALNKYKENKDSIKLLLFDIIMPQKTGKEAYDEIRAIRPDIKVLFQSGYAPDLVRQKVLLEDKMPVVFKPVTPMMLLKQVRSVLDQVK